MSLDDTPPTDDDADGDDFPDLPPEQARRFACLELAIDRAGEQRGPAMTAQILNEARAFDAFILNG
jgi:hypothetical protein